MESFGKACSKLLIKAIATEKRSNIRQSLANDKPAPAKWLKGKRSQALNKKLRNAQLKWKW